MSEVAFSLFDEGKLPKSITQIAKEHFGITLDPREAGYILENGEMLDFSGRHYASGYEHIRLPIGEVIHRPLPGQPDYLRGQRSTDHREIAPIFGYGISGLGLSGVDAMIKFEHEANAIRFHLSMDGDLNISLTTAQHPTLAQWDRLNKIQRSTGGVVFFDIYDGRDIYTEFVKLLESGEVKSVPELERRFKAHKPV